MYVVSTTKGKSEKENTDHPKEESEQNDLNKELHGKETDDTKETETAKNNLVEEDYKQMKLSGEEENKNVSLI